MYRFLIIDDEELIRKGTLKKLAPLSDRILCVGEAENGQMGLTMIEEKQPDFVILDMQMPVMGGMELLPELSRLYPHMPLIVISGYKNFDYIKQAISAQAVEYLLKPFSREVLQKSVEQVILRLEETTEQNQKLQLTEEEAEHARCQYDITLLHNLIRGYRVQQTTLTSHRLRHLDSTHDLLLLTLQFMDKAGSIDEAGFSSWLESSHFSDFSLYISSPEDGQDQGFFLVFLPREAFALQHSLSGQITRALLTYLETQQQPARIGMSAIHQSLEELGSAYRETAQALDCQLLTGESRSLFPYEGSLAPLEIRWPDTEEFLFRIEAGMSDAVSDLSRHLFLYYAGLPGLRLGDVKSHSQWLAHRCRQLLGTYLDTQTGTGSSDSMENIARHLFSLQALEDYYSQFYFNISVMLKPRSVYRNEDVIENVKTYLHRNFRQDLTQDFLASLFYLNRSYLSSLFRARTGEKFIDYLNTIRISYAADLLKNSDHKTAYIARAAGYDNVKYFFRVFKKKTGMTPEQYRQSLRR